MPQLPLPLQQDPQEDQAAAGSQGIAGDDNTWHHTRLPGGTCIVILGSDRLMIDKSKYIGLAWCGINHFNGKWIWQVTEKFIIKVVKEIVNIVASFILIFMITDKFFFVTHKITSVINIITWLKIFLHQSSLTLTGDTATL